MAPFGCLLSALVHTNVQYVASAQNHISEICRGRIASVFDSPVQNYVHVAVAVDHLAAVLNVVLQSDDDIGV